jgi:hypothetical protein
MRTVVTLTAICLGMSVMAIPASAQRCVKVRGKGVWTVIPPSTAPASDPVGRVLGPTTGTLKAAMTAYLTSLAPQPDGTLKATSVETWVVSANDLLVFDGVATFTPIPDTPVGTVSDALKLTVIGGTGAFAGASGVLNVTGTGYNLFGPNAGPGKSYFDIRYTGEICTSF